MRRSRSSSKREESGDDDTSPMVVGTGVTVDYSAVDNASLNVVVRGVMRHAMLKAKSVMVTGRFHGTVEATNLELAKGALFVGKAVVRSATVAGRLDGILLVSDVLAMRSSGHCDGVLRYGRLNVQARRKGEQACRLVDRDGHFHQSNGKWNIRRLKAHADTQKLIGLDPFHSFLNQSTLKIILRIMGVYLGLVLIFAIIYTTISMTIGCNLQLTSIREGFLFSLETMTTVGYGTHDYLFGSCWIMIPVLSLQACIGLLIDAFLIGILFARLSRPQTRANTVVFTKNAVIRRVRGESYFMFQIGELRKHQLLETRVRCYALRHERLTSNPGVSAGGGIGESGIGTNGAAGGLGDRSSSVSSFLGISTSGGAGSGAGVTAAELAEKMPEQVFFQSHSMRLQHPDDELGANLLLVLPQTVVHRIDAWSPMMPPPRWNSSHGLVQWGLHTDRDMVKAPWEDPPSPERNSAQGGGGAAAAAAATAARAAASAAEAATAGGSSFRATSGSLDRSLSDSSASEDGQDPEAEGLLSRKPSYGQKRRQSTVYWEDASVSEFGFNVNERGGDGDANNLGYVHRFPDLLKRWDDVDGDRGTWYEKMKRRLLRVEMERRKAEDTRKERELGRSKTTDETRLARAGFRRPLERRASIMHIGDEPAPATEITEIHGADRANEAPGLAKVPEGFQTLKSDPAERPPPAAAAASASAAEVGSAGSLPPLDGGAGGLRLSAGQWFAREERKAIDAYLQDRELEVVVILEGTDTSTGSTVQARHSYCWEDILWDRTFACCVTRGEDGACEVDFSKFHDTLPAPANCEDHGFIQSYA